MPPWRQQTPHGNQDPRVDSDKDYEELVKKEKKIMWELRSAIGILLKYVCFQIFIRVNTKYVCLTS